MRTVLSLLALAGCVDGGDKPDTGDTLDAEPCVADPMPLLTVEEDEIDFGTVAMGYTFTGLAQVHNDGDAPLSVGAIGVRGEVPDFGVYVDVGRATCASEVGDTIVLEPGCELPVTVTYEPETPGGAAAALVVTSGEAASDGSYGPDPIHGGRVVWLEGATDGEVGDPGYVVGDLVEMEQTAAHEGETVAMEARYFGAEPASWDWSAAGGTFADPAASVVEYTAPQVDPPGADDNVYVDGTEPDGEVDWVFAGLSILDESEPLYPCE